ncbi:MAG: hypothetical protein QOD98_862 [Nocardioidaceae bacterium]|nr:hypothetical protein [Nocardioidaceae bacterium]
MKELLRTMTAGLVGALVAIAVVVGQPALAGQVDKTAAKNSVTSKSIKNGAIKTKDLSAEVTGPLAKAGTALQSVPDNSVTTTKLANNAVTNPKLADNAVTNAEVADNAIGTNEVTDNSLKAQDIAVARGTVGLDFANLASGSCGATVGIETGHVVTGDFFLVTEPAGIAGNIQFFVREDAGSPTAIDIVECNDGNSAFDAPAANYSWAVIDN